MRNQSRFHSYLSVIFSMALLVGLVGTFDAAYAAALSGRGHAANDSDRVASLRESARERTQPMSRASANVRGCAIDLISNWKLDESGRPTLFHDFFDGNDATCSSGTCPTPELDGMVGGAQDFDGTNDRLITGNTSNPTSGITVMAWVNPDTLSAGKDKGIFYKEGAFLLELESDTNFSIDFSVIVGGALLEYEPKAQPASIGQWTHLAGTYDGTTDGKLKVYINGAQIPGYVKKVGTIDSNDSHYYIGYSFRDLEHRYFDGKIDDVAVFNRALSAAEIAQFYNKGKSNPVCSYFSFISEVIK